MRIAVCDVIEDIYRQDSEKICSFPDVIKWHFLLYYNQYVEIVADNKEMTVGANVVSR